jgi:ADP-ribose pyrophosphatase YjhB (NUDIX family)
VVVREGRVLLVRRAHDPWRDAWCVPSGFCDGPEHPIVAAEREVREESGLSACVTGVLGTWIDRYSDDPADEDAEIVSVTYYAAELVDEDSGPVDPDEIAEVGWFAWADLPARLAPPRTLPAVLAHVRAALRDGPLVTPLPDRPSSPPA